jgi:hypothetical protein
LSDLTLQKKTPTGVSGLVFFIGRQAADGAFA